MKRLILLSILTLLICHAVIADVSEESCFPTQDILHESSKHMQYEQILGITANEDIAVLGILSPEYRIRKTSLQNPEAMFGNYGDTTSTFTAYCAIDSSGTEIYRDSINITLTSAEDSAVSFSNWQVGSSYNITYTVTFYAVCPGDTLHSNDTLFFTVETYQWISMPDMPEGLSGCYMGQCKRNDSLFIHALGGGPTDMEHYIFDGESWTAGTTIPTTMNYGTSCSVDNMIYLIGNWNTVDPVMYIYNTTTDSFESRVMPNRVNDCRGVMTQDSNYIYVIGGAYQNWEGSGSVMMYDIAGDSFWSTVTQLPTGLKRMGGAAGYIGNDTIIYTCGIDELGSASNSTFFGIIDSVKPDSITWLSGPDYPDSAAYRVNGGYHDNKFYITGGSVFSGYFLDCTYIYESGTGWIQLQNKLTPCSNYSSDMVYMNDSWYFVTCGGYNNTFLDIFEIYDTEITMTGIVLDDHYNEGAIDLFNMHVPSIINGDYGEIQLLNPQSNDIYISMSDVLGRNIMSIEFSHVPAGEQVLRLNLTDKYGNDLRSGTYFITIKAGNAAQTGKFTIIE